MNAEWGGNEEGKKLGIYNKKERKEFPEQLENGIRIRNWEGIVFE